MIVTREILNGKAGGAGLGKQTLRRRGVPQVRGPHGRVFVRGVEILLLRPGIPITSSGAGGPPHLSDVCSP
jgi:hypothetical protein